MKIYIIILISLLALNSNAQECGTPISITNQVFNISDNYDSQFCVSIKFHIVRETNGTGGFDVSQIPNVINYINQFFNSHLINVSSIGFDYINNSNLNSFDDSEFNQLTAINNSTNAINFYIVNSAPYNGRAGAIISNNLVIRIDRVLAPTAPHELGHCFNLLHTFQGTATGTGGCVELTNGTNCSSCGDNVCDTPADANVGASGGYSPDMTNTMSYYTTRDHFTTQQGARMRNAIGGSSILQAALSSQCTSIIGVNTICGISNYQYTFSNPQNTSVTWSVTSNLQIVNSSNTGITIKAINSTINGTATITANLNGMLITKVIWIGKPRFTIKEIKEISSWDLYLVDSNLQNQGISSVTWSKVSGTGVVNGSGFYGQVDGSPTVAWNVTIKITLSNACGFTEIIKTYSNPDADSNPHTFKTSNNTYTIYPNPTTDIVNIEIKQYDKLLNKELKTTGELFDLMGNSILKIDISKNNIASFSVRGLNKGLYVLKILVNYQIENYQIIVE
jgi:hypothetical protein